MKVQFQHQLYSSLGLFLENKLLQKGEAFTNTTGIFYSDSRSVNGLTFSNSPQSQWVYDSAISGAIIPSGVYLNSVFVPRGTSGVSMDFMNGGAYHSGTFSVSGAYAKKDFNFYLMPEEDTELLLETAFATDDPLNYLTGSNNFNITAPCIILNKKDNKNEAFAFGGEDQTESFFQATIIDGSPNGYLRDGANSIFSDLNETCFPVVEFADVPFNSMGDLKTGYFNYNDLLAQYPNPIQRSKIDRVIAHNIIQRNDGRRNFYLGYAEFRVLSWRYPRL